jgi:protoporphyrinogen oxidase
VGGGVLGMTLAHRLALHGHDVTLLEAAPELGGLAGAWQLGEVVWDRHYHVTLLSDTNLRGLLSELGLEREMRWAFTRTGFQAGGRVHSLSNALDFLRFPLLGPLDKLRLAATILHASRIRDWRPLETVSACDWLLRWSGRRTCERVWLPLLRAKLGDNYRSVSAAFIWATIARLYAARRSGLKREMFGYLPGGYARILERFGARLAEEGVRIRLAQPVRRVDRAAEGGLAVETEAGARDVFDQVALTVPAGLAAQACPSLAPHERERLLGVRYQGIVCASLLTRAPLGGFYVTNLTEPWVPFTGVIEMSALVDRDQFGGQCLVYLPKYLDADDPGFAAGDEQIRGQFLAALERIFPSFRRDDVLAFRVSRVRRVFALPTLHYSSRLPPMTTSVPGLHIVNSAHILNGTLNVNETIRLAEQAAERLRALPAPAAAGVPA